MSAAFRAPLSIARTASSSFGRTATRLRGAQCVPMPHPVTYEGTKGTMRGGSRSRGPGPTPAASSAGSGGV